MAKNMLIVSGLYRRYRRASKKKNDAGGAGCTTSAI